MGELRKISIYARRASIPNPLSQAEGSANCDPRPVKEHSTPRVAKAPADDFSANIGCKCDCAELEKAFEAGETENPRLATDALERNW
jgi:hypothetical protein